MNINTILYDEDNSDCLINYIEGEQATRMMDAAFYSWSGHKTGEMDKNLHDLLCTKDGMKKLLGRQQKCVTYSNRNWVWTVENKGTVLHIMASIEGIKWQFDPRGDVDDAIEIIEWLGAKI